MSIPGSSGGFDFKSTDRMANLKNALFLVAFCSLCSGMPTDEGGQEVSRFMLVVNSETASTSPARTSQVIPLLCSRFPAQGGKRATLRMNTVTVLIENNGPVSVVLFSYDFQCSFVYGWFNVFIQHICVQEKTTQII